MEEIFIRPFILDVRSEIEHMEDPVGGSYNIPLQELSERYEELPKDKIIVLFCRTGLRSNMASGTLKDLGYKVADYKTADAARQLIKELITK